MNESVVSGGGRSCPPLSCAAPDQNKSHAWLQAAVPTVLTLLLAGACVSATAQVPPGRNASPAVLRPQGVAPRQSPAVVLRQRDVMARKLLRMMLRPTASYVGVQETIIQENGGMASEQDIEGDAKGFVRITFRSPARVAGDVMIIAPGSFHSFHRLKNMVEVAPWPTEWNDEGKRMFANLLNGTVTARMTGAEMVAGRSAGIVVLSVRNNQGADGGVDGRVLRKLWIDEQNGILLKIQKSNGRGEVTSTTMMTSITINPSTPINPADFKPQFPGADITQLFPEPQYRTMQDAQGHLPFVPVEPAPRAIPANFHLDGVWGFGEDRTHPFLQSVLLRFTDGIASFSLYERLVPPGKAVAIERPLKRSFARMQQNWRLQNNLGQINVQYIGHLTRDQAESIYDTLH